MSIKIIEELSMLEYFARDEATLLHALLNRFPTFGDEILLHDIDVMFTVHLSDCQGLKLINVSNWALKLCIIPILHF